MPGPAVSVILPVFNGERYLREAIQSVLAQTLKDFELIVVDDGSTDSSAGIAQSLGDRVKFVRQENRGVAGAFNHGLRVANGRFISWLSHDDVFYPTKLEKQIAALDQLGQPGVCYTDVDIINDNGTVTSSCALPEYGREQLLRHVLTASPILLASYSICYHRDCLDVVGFYSESWRYTQDADMLVRLARRFPFTHVPERLVQVREHADRGIKSPAWQKEVVRFFRESLEAIPFAEVFGSKDASREDRARTYTEIGDAFAARADVMYKVAYSQYARAIRDNPTPPQILRSARRMLGLYRYRRAGQ